MKKSNNKKGSKKKMEIGKEMEGNKHCSLHC